ncbi:porin family protein [Fibrella aquatilis]|uniref:PorT family protein n=1 Tax=Fibrella aquatilis TaxID=2817059 RepID=A0A939GBS0_9BACT|nr:porin family protein [Fibrella aquatilis]MBO0934640.1 PorT family protein [Fibrella aquatilis]
MKKYIKLGALAAIAAAGLSLYSTTANAQTRPRTGIKAGLSASSLFYDNANATDKKERIGFHAGVFTQLPIGSAFAIQPELLYINKGASSGYSAIGNTGRNSFNLNYAELPVLATIKLGNFADIQAGPYVGYLLSSNVKTEGSLGNVGVNLNPDQFNRVDYGLAGGVNVYFGQLLIGARYEQGLQKIANTTASQAVLNNARNGVGLLSIGYSFN